MSHKKKIMSLINSMVSWKHFLDVTKTQKVIPGCEVSDASVVDVANALVDVGSDAVVVSAGDVTLTTKYCLSRHKTVILTLLMY